MFHLNLLNESHKSFLEIQSKWRKEPEWCRPAKEKEVKEPEDDTLRIKSKEIIEDDDSSDDEKKKKKTKKKEDVKKKDKAKLPQGPVHIGTSDQLSLKTDLDAATFAQCKEKMRAVKKSLKALDKPDPKQTPEEQVKHLKNHCFFIW